MRPQTRSDFSLYRHPQTTHKHQVSHNLLDSLTTKKNCISRGTVLLLALVILCLSQAMQNKQAIINVLSPHISSLLLVHLQSSPDHSHDSFKRPAPILSKHHGWAHRRRLEVAWACSRRHPTRWAAYCQAGSFLHQDSDLRLRSPCDSVPGTLLVLHAGYHRHDHVRVPRLEWALVCQSTAQECRCVAAELAADSVGLRRRLDPSAGPRQTDWLPVRVHLAATSPRRDSLLLVCQRLRAQRDLQLAVQPHR